MKLTPTDAAMLRRIFDATYAGPRLSPIKFLAREFGITAHHCWLIVRRKRHWIDA